MRKFIVSDLHGNGDIYDSIMAYLENVQKNTNEDVILYINGDLIDRGEDSARMLIDIKTRIINHIGFKIEYLAGNHELLMYDASLRRIGNTWNQNSDWFWENGGERTAYDLKNLVSLEEELEIIKFVSNLKIYHKFKECLNGKPIILVHAKCPKKVEDTCHLKVLDHNLEVEDLLWTRKEDPWTLRRAKVGHKDYFTIIGHTPVDTKTGYIYYKDDNCLNIDGGCAAYALDNLQYDHIPLVEIDDQQDRLIILTFNHDNEIISGHYFSNGISIEIKEEELNEYRKYLNKEVKVKKILFKNKNGE